MRTSRQLLLAAFGCALAFSIGVAAHKLAWPLYTVPRDLLKLALNIKDESKYRGDPGTRWRKADTPAAQKTGVRTPEAAGTENDLEEQIRQLEALGYASGSQPSTGDAGVKITEEGSTSGVLLMTDGHAPYAWLMDMKGNELHHWTKEFDDAFPGNTVDDDTDGVGYFRRVTLLPKGELLAIYEGLGLVKLDSRSNVVWAYGGHAHHDLEVQPDGTIYVLTQIAHLVPHVNPTEAILEDFVTQLGPDGKELQSFSIIEAVRTSQYRSLLQNSSRTGDLFHTNSIQVLSGKLAAAHPAFKQGNILLSLREVHAIVVVDPQLKQVVWTLAGLTSFQHDAQELGSDRIMVFDNRGDAGKSRILEIDIATHRIVWEYSGQKHGFYSFECGTAQRLPSGDTLITESEPGRAFIVTPEGRKIWEYVTPHRAGPKDEFVATLFEVFQLPQTTDSSWLSPKPSSLTGSTHDDRHIQ